ncbi:hypothetical protein GCM10027262_32020 [Nocardia tengchongensis]
MAAANGAVRATAAETAAMPAALRPMRRMFFIKRFPNSGAKLPSVLIELPGTREGFGSMAAALSDAKY